MPEVNKMKVSVEKSVAIYWMKRDFRLHDNVALEAALNSHSTVVPVFILEPSCTIAPETSLVHINALAEALADFREKLHVCGSEMLVLRGEVVPIFQELYAALPFGYVYAHEEVGIDRTFKRDVAVHRWAKSVGVQFREFPQTGVVRRLKNRDDWAVSWKTFYMKPAASPPSEKRMQKLVIPDVWKQTVESFNLATEDFLSTASRAKLGSLTLQPVSESRALSDLHDFFFHRGVNYRGGISSPNSALTAGSRLSVHLAYGTISGRYVYQKLNERIVQLATSNEPNAKRWLSSLISFKSRLHWRDHFMQRLETEPRMEFRPINPAFLELKYGNNPAYLVAFFNGKTGFPMIDAVMRCLQQTRFINFRMRSMVTSFACHALHLSWQKINAPLARLFLDYEPGIHLSQLQMQAGVVGINTLRTYNPTKQIIDQDPRCIFIKKWLPELANYTPAEIIDHVNFPVAGYPPPIVDWKISVAQMRKMIHEIRQKQASKEMAQTVFQKHGSRKKNTMGKRRSQSKSKQVPANAPTLFD